MVHGLETIIKLNNEAIATTGKNKKKVKLEIPCNKHPYYSARRSSEMIPIAILEQYKNYYLRRKKCS